MEIHFEISTRSCHGGAEEDIVEDRYVPPRVRHDTRRNHRRRRAAKNDLILK